MDFWFLNSYLEHLVKSLYFSQKPSIPQHWATARISVLQHSIWPKTKKLHTNYWGFFSAFGPSFLLLDLANSSWLSMPEWCSIRTLPHFPVLHLTNFRKLKAEFTASFPFSQGPQPCTCPTPKSSTFICFAHFLLFMGLGESRSNIHYLFMAGIRNHLVLNHLKNE